MDRVELDEVLRLVKAKLSRDVQAACGLLWTDQQAPTSWYAVGEEDATTHYAVGEEDGGECATLYAIGECDE